MSRRPPGETFSQRLLGIYLHPAVANRGAAMALLVALVFVIGIADYFTGLEISLTILFLVPITLATGWFGWRTGVGFAAASVAARVVSDALIVYPRHLPLHTYWRFLASGVIYLFIVWLLDSLLALHRALEAKVEERTNELKESIARREKLEQEILEVGARERSAIGRDLHDDLGQHLTATALAAQTLVQQLGDRPEAARARSIVRWIEDGTQKARKLARGLLLEHIEPERLPQELEELVRDANQGGARVQFHSAGGISANGAECAQLFRIAQEALGNALRHADARTISVTLGADDHALCLVVEDDGRGFAAPQGEPEGYGLRIMEHRAKLVGASLALISSPGSGSKVICRLPNDGRVEV